MMITGRKTEYPFIVNFTGTKSSPADSFMFTFLRADFIIYIRPDLQIVTLGKWGHFFILIFNSTP